MNEMRPKYPYRVVHAGENAYAILAVVRRALRDEGEPPEVVDEYMNNATSQDYAWLLDETRKWVTVR